MSGNNQFYPFGTAVSAQLLSDEAWSDADPSSMRCIGQPFNSPAYARLWNKALRQATLGAAGLGQFIANQNVDALDNNASDLADALERALDTYIQHLMTNVYVPASLTDGTVLPANTDHNDIDGRDEYACHPMSAITGLNDKLQEIRDALAAIAANVPNADYTTKGLSIIATDQDIIEGESETKFTTPYTLKRFAISLDQLPTIATSKFTTDTFSADRIPNLAASIITTGVFDSARIPGLSADKIVTGVFDAARLPTMSEDDVGDLDASKITSGVFAVARIPVLNASKITSGVFATARIPGLDASKIVSGTIASARLPSTLAFWANITGDIEDNVSLNTAVASKEVTANKTTVIDSNSTDDQYPTAKAVKEYVDGIIPHRTWGSITGTIASQTDLNNAINGRVTKNSNIRSGIRTKVTYDSKGLITGGSALSAADIPNLPVSKITGTFTNDQLAVGRYDRWSSYTAEPYCRLYGNYTSSYTDDYKVDTVMKTARGSTNPFMAISTQQWGRLYGIMGQINAPDSWSYLVFENNTGWLNTSISDWTPQLSGLIYINGEIAEIMPGEQYTRWFTSLTQTSAFQVYFRASRALAIPTITTLSAGDMYISLRLAIRF